MNLLTWHCTTLQLVFWISAKCILFLREQLKVIYSHTVQYIIKARFLKTIFSLFQKSISVLMILPVLNQYFQLFCYSVTEQ